MSFSIPTQSNQFAVARGAQVTSMSDRSIFGNPSSSSDLVVTTKSGDAEPRFFEIGDTYDLTFNIGGASYVLSDAAVIRSDAAPGGGGIIVFEGTDNSGTATQVLWTPDFNLQGWYNSNHDSNGNAYFWTSDQNASYSHGYVCFAAETLIATPHGPMRAGDIEPGDRVDTLDSGTQIVRWAGRMRLPGQGAGAPIRFAAGAIGNDAPLRLSPQHRVLIRSERAELMFCAPEVLVPAKAMINGGTIRPAPCAAITYVHLLLDRHEMLWAEGALCESLFLGDRALALLEGAGPDDPDCRMIEGLRRMTGLHDAPARPLLTAAEARVLLGHPAPRRHARLPPALV